MCDSAELPLLGVVRRVKSDCGGSSLRGFVSTSPCSVFEQKGFSTHFEIGSTSAATSPSLLSFPFPNEGLKRGLAWDGEAQQV